MTEQRLDVDPRAAAFVARVRELMADLPPDEQEELTAGLAADLSELVAEHGPERLGDPADYARELRLAAGHPAAMPASRRSRPLARAAMESLDAAHLHWDRLLDALPYGGPRGFLTSLQPVWWVARAWVAWMVAQDVRGPYVVLDGQWVPVLVVLLVVSVQLGRRGWGVGRLLAASVLARLLLLGLNVFAVTMLPGAVDNAAWAIAEARGPALYGHAWYETS